MLKRFRNLLNTRGRKSAPVYGEINSPPPRRLLLTEASILAMRDSIVPEIKRGHEGVAYLFGLTNGATTVVVGAIRPESRTTSGSFNVSAVAMARCEGRDRHWLAGHRSNSHPPCAGLS